MKLEYELYWSFRSPYSYMLMNRLVAFERKFDITGRIRPVYPLAVRTPEFFDTRDPLWFSYFKVDMHREAQFLGLPFRWPVPDPVYMDMISKTYPKEQPYIHRLTRMGVIAAEHGRGLQYLDEVSRVIWSGQVDNWHQGKHLDDAAQRAGLNPIMLNTEVECDASRLHAVVEASQVAQRGAGHYGVPLLVFNGEPFFGQDRFDQFALRMRQAGVKPR